MRFRHGELHGAARLRDLVGHEAFRPLAEFCHALDQTGARKTMRRLPVDHAPGYVRPPVRVAQEECTALAWLDLDREAGEILPGELRADQGLPHFLRRRG